MMKQLVRELGPNTPLGKATMENWKAEARARPPKAKASREAGIIEIPLEQLEDSPYQLRHNMDSDALAELTRSIEENGLLNPILVRRKGDKYEVISGHRRLAAYRRLQFAAKTDKEKQKYAAIPARELPSVTDEQMLLLGLTENLLRADISPLDAALGLQALRKLRPALNTAKKMSATTGLQLNKVTRLLRLADSPDVVQQGVRDGLAPDADAKKDDGAADVSEHHRTLDLMPALEFTRLYEFLSKKGGKRKDGASSADEQTRQAIAHALKAEWGLREVSQYVDKVISEPAARDAKKQRGRPGTPFKKNSKQLVVYYGRLESLSVPQGRALLAALQDLVRRVSAQLKNHQ